jgi:hypothetical protein
MLNADKACEMCINHKNEILRAKQIFAEVFLFKY